MKSLSHPLVLVLTVALGIASLPSLTKAQSNTAPSWRLGTFAVDVTPPLGHMLFTGGFQKATGVTSRLEARGFVLLPPESVSAAKADDSPQPQPYVVCSFDWGEIRNDAYDSLRETLAEAAGTVRERVLLCSIHQHDTPLGDLTAQRILDEAGSEHDAIDLAFFEDVRQRLGVAAADASENAGSVTHYGVGKSKVEGIASNRRYVLEDGSVHYDRGSATKNLSAQRAPVGDIDPWLRTLSFWNGEQAVCALSVYATHPMSFYRTAKVDADFPGLARSKLQSEDKKVFQIYASGCSGNVTAGKYNDGDRAKRAVLADRLYQGMLAARKATEKYELGGPGEAVVFRNAKLRLEPRQSDGYSKDALTARIAGTTDARDHCMAALGLSWQAHAGKPEHRIDVPAIDFGDAALLLLPGEMYIEYQLYANQVAGEGKTIITMGYGECGPGYIPIERAWKESDHNLSDWCWVAKGMEPRVKAAIRESLGE